MLVNQPDVRSLVNDLVAHHFRDRPVAVLEAGGGSHTQLDLAALDLASITTVDISPEQLERNTYADHKILGDLQAFAPARAWDLVVVYNVLEHIPRADLAVENLVAACADDGLIVVGGPSAHAFSGFVTRMTPHWFHVFVHRFALGSPDAGKPGHAPFPTFFHPASQPGRLAAMLEARGFDCDFLAFYEGEVYRQMRAHRPIVGLPLLALTGLVNAVTPKRYNARHGDFCAIFRKRPAQAAAEAVPEAAVPDGIGDDIEARLAGTAA